MPVPELRENEVLVEVHATGVNLLDSKIRSGQFKPFLPYREPFVLGHHKGAVLVGVGSRVQQFKRRDEVYSRPDDFQIGTFAEFVAVKETSLAHKPKNLAMEEVASIPLVRLTASQALVEKANLKRSERSSSGRFRWRWHICNPFGETSRRNRRHHRQLSAASVRISPPGAAHRKFESN